MSSTNTFNLLLDDDNEDPSQLIAAQIKVAPPPKKAPASAQVAQPTKQAALPSKPLPPAQAVRDARNGGPRGGGAGSGRGSGRGFGRRGGREGGFGNDSIGNENSFSSGTYGGPAVPRPPNVDGDNVRRGGYGGPRGGGGGRGGRRGGFDNGESDGGVRPRRNFERHSGTGRGHEIKRDGSGRGNWGSPTEEIVLENEETVNEAEKTVETEKPTEQEQSENAVAKENPEKDGEVKEPEPEEDKEMTLEEYEKVREEKRKALLAQKSEERKVPVDKEFASMQLLSSKKTDAEIFVKLGSDKEKRKEVTEKEERAKKSVSINEFLKPAEGEAYYGRGRGRGGRRGGGRGGGGYGGGGGGYGAELAAPLIDETNFPSLGGK